MKTLLLSLLLTACSYDQFVSADPPDTSTDAPVGVHDDASDPPEAEAGDLDASTTDVEAACTPITHWNGYAQFTSCETTYTPQLALDACNAYFGSGCTVMPTDGGWCTDMNMVGRHSVEWITWTWTADSGTTRESAPTPPDCPLPTDPSWY